MNLLQLQGSPILRGGLKMRMSLGLLAALCFIPEAGAVFLDAPIGSNRRITMRVGSANTVNNVVTFNVTNANVSPNPTPITGVPNAGANPSPSPAQTNGVEVNAAAVFTNTNGNTVTVTVNSSVALQCVASTGCGNTTIPFSSIKWTSYNLAPSSYGGGLDIQSGTFAGSALQQLSKSSWTGGTNSNGSTTLRNVLVFEYDNATLYPAGQYTGTVTFTATNE